MSNLANLLLREVVDANYQTKGGTLTFAELDGNFILLANVIKENIVDVNPGGIEPYSGTTEYSNGDFVTYGGNLWEYTNPTPSTGNVPASGSTFWTLQSSGALAHKQNTDTHTTANRFGIGNGTADDNKEIFARNGSDTGSEPRIRYNVGAQRWEVSNNGTDFNAIDDIGNASTGTNTSGEIELDMANKGKIVFVTEDPIAEDSHMDLANAENGTTAVWWFTVENLALIHFSDNMLFSDARVDGAKQWQPFDNGLYKAEFTRCGDNWAVDVYGPYA